MKKIIFLVLLFMGCSTTPHIILSSPVKVPISIECTDEDFKEEICSSLYERGIEPVENSAVLNRITITRFETDPLFVTMVKSLLPAKYGGYMLKRFTFNNITATVEVAGKEPITVKEQALSWEKTKNMAAEHIADAIFFSTIRSFDVSPKP